MIVSIIVAMDENLLIGNDAGLPWHLPADLKRFRKLTMGKPIIMGRTTRERIGRALDGRLNIVLSSKADYQANQSVTAHSLGEALEISQRHLDKEGGDETMVIGGATVYHHALRLCQRIYLTLVHGQFSGSTYFPVDPRHSSEWKLVSSDTFPPDTKNAIAHTFSVLGKENTDGPPSIVSDPAANSLRDR